MVDRPRSSDESTPESFTSHQLKRFDPQKFYGGSVSSLGSRTQVQDSKTSTKSDLDYDTLCLLLQHFSPSPSRLPRTCA
ncbi:hypothetical protein TNCT_387051 [Trichonephila clavata]|uniref:Uncharacterized protein n=1 Tax=Trichonephila clavata TaxID=2740835 RepID=A0A8X6JG43_TRICU|nr:hypothetical protein TNCT_387051 [Trichonephila clavata]